MLLKRHFIDKRNWIIISLLFLMLFLVLHMPAAAQGNEKKEVNYCNDEESWKEWDDLVVKYPNDEDIIILHALRLGLCAKVSRGDIKVQQATDIFEKVREIIIERKKVATKKDKGV